MSIDWLKIYGQGRCKAIGIAWTDQEMKEVCDSNFNPQVIKKLRGEIPMIATQKKIEVKEKNFEDMTQEELISLAKEKGIKSTHLMKKETLIEKLLNFSKSND